MPTVVLFKWYPWSTFMTSKFFLSSGAPPVLISKYMFQITVKWSGHFNSHCLAYNWWFLRIVCSQKQTDECDKFSELRSESLGGRSQKYTDLKTYLYRGGLKHHTDPSLKCHIASISLSQPITFSLTYLYIFIAASVCGTSNNPRHTLCLNHSSIIFHYRLVLSVL